VSTLDPTSPVRDVFVYLCVRGGEAAIGFYTRVFGAREITRMTDDTGRIAHAELQLGPTVLMLADEHPEYGVLSPLAFTGSGVTVHLHVDDVDTMTRAAAEAGAVILREPADQPHGERQSRFRDPFGHLWLLGSPI
jgi:PhnB protein